MPNTSEYFYVKGTKISCACVTICVHIMAHEMAAQKDLAAML